MKASSSLSSGSASLDSALEAGRRVLLTEAGALHSLAESLDGPFSAALERLLAVKGRVVVTGMGKSGHIGAKIAATLASTGTPAFFVHPAEASHGDLGMVTQDDAVIALSNSGETAELADIVAYTRRFAIPLIGITGRADSALAVDSDVALVMPAFEEACPHGLAPTTSTTLMLALGDALAVALLESKGFSAEDFRIFHPGGKLGQRLMRVADLMHGPQELPLCTPDTLMADVLVEMTGKSLGCAGVMGADGRLAGMITDGDLRRHMEDGLMRRRAVDVMTPDPMTVSPTLLAGEALHRMNSRKVTGLFVVDPGGRPVGFLHVHDLLRAGIV
ncbi:KpsF/GutQ family sugar-phosphate isomerase [Haematospirillum sp. 15-248]|uniref:KpsF/GutQ family sugar-phosphate isomerase n=1 Tax=Haematospirillum sp. 15-248 TaxID=2723107 RepID=UPI001439EBB4|nr:KpsF/GutQ family sugar-phosphate isomerase [Haematospirillum sp. 15-248]NKD88562.1 KpsF/GutQ family sugar-phosphate isomerase [Haematospirillum sp. 15-248]